MLRQFEKKYFINLITKKDKNKKYNMLKNWLLRDPADENTVNKLQEDLGVNKIVCSLLAQRGIKNYEEAKEFFRPEINHLHNPFLMSDMDKASDRLKKAVENNENILIYGDYDVDGTSSVAIMYLFLKKFFREPDFYVPDRYNEGYGISQEGIDYAAENKNTLIVALDCGIKANEKIKSANEKGIDVIICDHHLPGDKLPKAYAILDPKREGCKYPYKELSGCGIGFKLLQALAGKMDINPEELLNYIDLVSLSIACDIVPMTGENRVLASLGLKKINENPIKGMQSLISISGINDRKLEINDLVFKIGPRINAAGRIKSGKTAVELLISDNEDIASELGEEIDAYNTERKELDGQITEEALQLIRNDTEEKLKKATVLFNPDWHKGVIGIVASRVIEHYYKPTIILTESNGIATGSARSVKGFDIYKAIDQCSDLLEGYGGHMYAAGLSMKIENIDNFIEKFESIISSTIKEEQTKPYIEIDAGIRLRDITPRFYNLIDQFKPFGPGNMRPVFVSEKVFDSGIGKIVGKENDHLRSVLIEKNNQRNYPGIAFKQADKFEIISSNEPFDVCYVIDENHFNGTTSLQLKIKDIRKFE